MCSIQHMWGENMLMESFENLRLMILEEQVYIAKT